MVPVLLALAWNEQRTAFLFAFAVGARERRRGRIRRAPKTGTTSELGAKLDSWGDLASYLVLPICAWWLWPERILAQLALVAIALVAFLAPTLVGLLKFRRLTSYHTRAAKALRDRDGRGAAAVSGRGVVWLFQIAVLLLVIEAIEEIAITTVLPAWRANVPSIFAARRICERARRSLARARARARARDRGERGRCPISCPRSPTSHFISTPRSRRRRRRGLRVSATERHRPAAPRAHHPQRRPRRSSSSATRCVPDCATHPNEVCADPSFICSPAGGHNHPHYENFMRYELLDAHGVQVGLGGKRSFCLCESGCLGATQNHTCSNQGLGAGCWDIYPRISAVSTSRSPASPTGAYTLRVTVDPGDEFVEANETQQRARAADRDRAQAATSTCSLAGQALAIRARQAPAPACAPDADFDPLPGVASDPTLGGALLHVVDTHEGSRPRDRAARFGLACARTGRRARVPLPRRGHRRRSVSLGGAAEEQAAREVQGHRDRRSRCPAEGEIFVQLDLGAAGKRFCATFGGKSREEHGRLAEAPEGAAVDLQRLALAASRCTRRCSGTSTAF